MAIRDRFMLAVMKARARRQSPDDEPDTKSSEPIMTESARLSLLFEGIKLIGTGNGAGALASVAAIYYFSSKADLHLLIKSAAIAFFVGLLIFALTVFGYVCGLTAASGFVDKYGAIADAKKIPTQALNQGIDGLMLLVFSLIGALLSLACFFIGTAIALYALIIV